MGLLRYTPATERSTRLSKRPGGPATAAHKRRARSRTRARRAVKKRKSQHGLLRFSLLALIVVSATALVGTGATIGIVDYFAGDLPSIDAIQTANLSQTTRILDRNGNLIEALYHENRTVVPLSKISLNLQKATIDTEDRTFYTNSGVDYRRLAIAVGYDLTHQSSTLGGSTITEQVVKNDVLDTAEAQSRTISRKFRDLVVRMIAARKAMPGARSPLTAHFVDYIASYIKQHYGEQALYEGGLTITTTLDLHLQASADRWVKSGVATYAKRGVNTGAMLVMNPADGEVLAMVGSADYDNAGIRGQINLTGMDPLGWRG